MYGLRLVGAGDAFWSNPIGDMGQMLAGELAGLRAPWSLPLLTPDTLIAPDRVSLVYTDSIPWLTALLKLLHLGRTFSLLGTFLLLAWLAQPAAMYLLLRASGVRRSSTLLAGMLLSLLVPAWLDRQLGHIALSGHAVQIAALALAVRCIRDGLTGWRIAGFVALGVLAAGVHAYHLPPVTLMLAAAMASEALQRRPKALVRGLRAGADYVLAVVAAARGLGYFVGRGASGGAGALGLYEMNAVYPVLPQASALAGQRWTGAAFTHTFDPTGSQSFEGFNYLGAGVLLVLLTAAVLLWRTRRRRGSAPASDVPEPPRAPWARRWGPLCAALVVLTLYALGTKPWIGPLRVPTPTLPDRPWMEPLALFRAHGRFFWTVGYALLAGGLTTVDRLAGDRLRRAVLLVAVLLQVADMSQLLVGLHDQFARPEPLHVPAAFRGRAFKGRDVRAYPAFFCTGSWVNQLVIRQLSVIVERQGASINAAPTARPPVGACERPPPADALADAAPGDRRITVVTGDTERTSALTTLFAHRSDCFDAGAVWMCGRDLAGVPGLTAVPGASLVKASHTDLVLALHTPGFRAALLSGWSAEGDNGVWSDGPRAVLRLPRPALPPDAFLKLTVDALGYQPAGRPPQRAEVSLGGRRLAEWRLDGPGYAPMEVMVPARALPAGSVLEFALDLPDAVSPDVAMPGSGDPRRLGVGIRRVTLAH